LARDLNAGAINGLALVPFRVVGQAEGVGAKRVGQDDATASANVAFGNLTYPIRMSQVPNVETRCYLAAEAKELRPPGAVCQGESATNTIRESHGFSSWAKSQTSSIHAGLAWEDYGGRKEYKDNRAAHRPEKG